MGKSTQFIQPLHDKYYCWEMNIADKYQCGIHPKTQIITIDEY